ncbi:MAG: DUF6754 domain-containing protein [bacterium]
MKRNLLLLFLTAVLLFSAVSSQDKPVSEILSDSINIAGESIQLGKILSVSDIPNDGGGGVEINWSLNDTLSNYFITIIRREGDERKVVATDLLASSQQVRDVNSDEDKSNIKDGTEYFYTAVLSEYAISQEILDYMLCDSLDMKSLKIADATQTYLISEESGPVTSKASWFNLERFTVLISAIIITLLFLFYFQLAKNGKEFYIRKINGLDAVEEAVGRSTEMGKPIMYILGIGYVTDIPTIAGLTILGRVAKKVAEYETKILVPSYDPVVMTTAQEVVKEAFTEAGRPDIYNKNDIMYITQDQFGYAAGVDGMMMREKPGAVFLQGLFFAESLILAETGHSIGAIQIAGTTETAQLPFFVAACDYTLIGEEMMAASVYLQKDPLMLGSIVAEDVMKVVIVIILIIGFLLGVLGPGLHIEFFNKLFNLLIEIL